MILASISLLCCTESLAQNAQVNRLTSEAWTPGISRNIKTTPEDDLNITKKMDALIKTSATLSKLILDIHTKNGVVFIKGTVQSNGQASTLVEMAQSIIGVSDVNINQLAVKDSKQPLTDTLITAKIKGLFIREKVFGNKDVAAVNVSVETKNNIVYLTGVINNKAQLKNALRIISSVKGVKKVEYNLKEVSITKHE